MSRSNYAESCGAELGLALIQALHKLRDQPQNESFLMVAGALGAVAIYLRRREKELDEYERLLFGEDDAATVEDTAEPAEAAEEAPAEDKAE